MTKIVIDGVVCDDLVRLKASDLQDQLTRKVGGRTTFYAQLAVHLRERPERSTVPLDGKYSPALAAALNAWWADELDDGTTVCTRDGQINLACWRAMLEDAGMAGLPAGDPQLLLAVPRVPVA